MSERAPMQQSATETARHIESAVHSGDATAYNHALAEVNKYGAMHSAEESKQYVSAVTKQLEDDKVLPRVALFGVKNNFGRIDVSEDNKLQERELSAFKGQRDLNGLQQNFIDHALRDFNKTKEAANDQWGAETAITAQDVDSALAKAAETEKNRNAITHLFEKGSGTSLYDRVRDSEGNVSKKLVDQMLAMDKQNPRALGLSDADRESLKLIKSKGDETKSDVGKDDLKTLCKENDADYAKLNPNETQRKQKELMGLFDKSNAGQSLYDRLKDADGNIPASTIKQYQEMDALNRESLKLSDRDRQTLKMLAGMGGDVTKEGLQKICAENGLDFGKAASGKLKLDEADKVTTGDLSNGAKSGTAGVEKSAAGAERPAAPITEKSAAGADTLLSEAEKLGKNMAEKLAEKLAAAKGALESMAAERQKVNEDALRKALTVHKGESYAHCAERLLALAGNNDPSAQQIRKLSHQLWVDDHRRQANGLKTNQVLAVDDAVRHNSDVAKLFS